MSVKTSFSNLCVVLKEKLGNKVDKVVGKGLSANDFTTAYKTKLDGIAAGATKITVDTTLSASSTNPVQNKAVNTAIINIKNDLINYYKKTETYSKTEIDTKISSIPKFSIKVVKTLPTTDISATTVYLKTSETSLAGNLYDEYIYVDSKWELLGSQTVDLSGYVTISSMNTALANKVDKVSGKELSTNDYTTAEKNKLAGIAAGANKTVVDSDISTTSTNPIQNKAVGLKFQGVDSEISGINSSLTAKTSEIATIVNEYGSKNLVNYSLITNSTSNGITRKNNNDGSITYSGTSTVTHDIYLTLMEEQNLEKGTYIFTPNPMTAATYTYQIYKNGTYWKNHAATQTIEITEAGKYSIGVAIKSNETISNTFKPMLRYASIKDDTYVPHAMTNRELTEKVADTGWVEVEFPKNTNFDPASYLLYRRCGNMVSFYGEFRITKNEDSSNYIHLLFKNLPKEDVAPELFSLDRFINAPYAKALVAVQRDPRIRIGVWMEVRVDRNGWVSIDFRTYSEEPIATGNVYTLNVTYML